MTIPGFTAEVSLGKPRESYILTPEASAENGMVLPQLLRPGCICWGEVPGYPGSGGCICHTPRRVPI
jgi:hypothetical protein